MNRKALQGALEVLERTERSMRSGQWEKVEDVRREIREKIKGLEVALIPTTPPAGYVTALDSLRERMLVDDHYDNDTVNHFLEMFDDEVSDLLDEVRRVPTVDAEMVKRVMQNHSFCNKSDERFTHDLFYSICRNRKCLRCQVLWGLPDRDG